MALKPIVKPHKRIVRPPEETQASAKSKYSELANINKNINTGLNSAPGTFVRSLLGSPTSKDVLNLTHFVDVGPFKVEGLDVATNSLRSIMSVVKHKYSDLYSRLSHQGMRVVKSIGGSKSTSLHSWGIAIDIKVDGVKDVRFNDKALYGLTLIAPIFHDYGWYWGAAFSDKETSKNSGVYWSNEDAMHFEVSKTALLAWNKSGLLKKKGVFSVGVLAVQKQKPTPNPIKQKSLPAGHMIIKPIPRRRGEPWLGWFCRTVSTRVRHPSSWFH